MTAATVNNFDVTALDIDGNGDKLREYVNLYNQAKYTCESNTALTISNLLETILSLLTVNGKKFLGPTKQYSGIDTSATDVMATNSFNNANQIRIRTGAQSTVLPAVMAVCILSGLNLSTFRLLFRTPCL